MKNTIISSIIAAALLICGCNGRDRQESKNITGRTLPSAELAEVLPITGTFINLPYQDVRNKYTNPQHLDCTDPSLWVAKIEEMKEMGK